MLLAMLLANAFLLFLFRSNSRVDHSAKEAECGASSFCVFVMLRKVWSSVPQDPEPWGREREEELDGSWRRRQPGG
ncbi:hypothetical protein AA0117_g10321 [Alternaria alternata]|uniref:Secreted protein n=1 Tax=Alternaria alternata TaxID=5599 RepID=A0A4V1WQI8_ALTAL|nr:hypothetical protein AA0117_g10321 [Alternaria alternata]